MRNTSFVAVLVITVAGLGYGATYTLDKLLDAGLRNSREIKIVEEEIVKTDAQIMEAKGAALPKVNVSANYQYAFAAYNPLGDRDMGRMALTDTLAGHGVDETSQSGAYIVAGALEGMIAGIDDLLQPQVHAVALTLSVEQPVFAQGKVPIGLRIAKRYKETLLCKYDAARQQVKASIVKLFYGALLAGKNLTIQRQAMALAEETHRLTLVRFSIGRGSEIDTLATRLSLNKSHMGLREAEGRRRTAFDALIKQSGVNSTVDEFSVTGEFPKDDFVITLDEALVQMHKNNRQIGQLIGGEQIRELLVRLEKSEYLPMVYFGGSIGKIGIFDEWNNIGWQDDQKVFVGARYTLFNGARRLQKVRMARAEHRKFVHTKRLALDKLELGVRDTYEKLETDRKQLASARALVVLAEKGYALSAKAYEVGAMTLNELQRKELDLNSAGMALNAAQFGFHGAVIDLKLLMGLLSIYD